VTCSVHLVENGLVVLHSAVFLSELDLLGEVSLPVGMELARMGSVRLSNQDGVRHSFFWLGLPESMECRCRTLRESYGLVRLLGRMGL